MGLRRVLVALAARNAHVLVVEVSAHWMTRVAVERAVVARGWILASSPADADVLAICGTVTPEFQELLDEVWQQLPGPRVRVDVDTPTAVNALLDDAHVRLLDTGGHRRDAHDRAAASDLLDDDDDDGMDMGGDSDMDMGDDSGMDMGDDSDMDMGDGMDMDMKPSGIALAEGGEDRDGLEMDVLHLPLGPILPFWPAGLVLHCTLQGDVIVKAGAVIIGPDHTPDVETVAASVARSIDNLVSLLALVGWEDATAHARKVRDELLDGDMDEAQRDFAVLQRRVRRSRMLRWSLRGVGPVNPEAKQEQNIPARLAGDSHDRLLAMLDRISRQLDCGTGFTEPMPSSAQLAECVRGLDLATARLFMSSLDLHGLEPRDVTSYAEQEDSHAG